ncbi:aminoglycoside phosphotransferase family protein [Limimaricola hongkongensis]|uniref:Putative phosphotransferase n=1 Tax=Limimaricola hongkongensis DSM 17492 TaxID=1122180 RepID=A0A017HHB7_9RHOB|nr:phosphotransferase [Limimaricola hongkongensis]EYD73184.1 putative phosphotransferase [Limimaricola hongkongensis DSM 17492]
MTETCAFLARHGLSDHARTALAGDASARRYERLTGPGGESLILMICPEDGLAALDAFVTIARHLTGIGLCAPRIHALDRAAGLAVIGDLGPVQVAQWAETHPGDTAPYAAAIDVLARLQAAAPPDGLSRLTPGIGAEMIAPLGEWYAPGLDLAALQAGLRAVLERHAPAPSALALRDFHAENLIWRPDRAGTDRIGLLDFQDALLAPPEYDLVSLLRDARRDVPDDLRAAMIARFAAKTGRDADTVEAACAALGVQRNLRILGIFARLARRDGKTRYLALMPRVRGQIAADLRHPALASLAPHAAALPQPEEFAP